MALVIPSYVPLQRLPAASGLQLATSGLLFIILGPIVGVYLAAIILKMYIEVYYLLAIIIS